MFNYKDLDNRNISCWTTIKYSVYDGLQYFKNIFITNKLEHSGRIIEVSSDDNLGKLPFYKDKCHHLIKMADGSKFMLVFTHVKFADIAKHIKVGCFVKIIYNKFTNRIINIFPQPFYRYMNYEDFLDHNDIDNETIVKVCYFEGNIRRIDFIGVPIDNNDSIYTDSNLGTESNIDDTVETANTSLRDSKSDHVIIQIDDYKTK